MLTSHILVKIITLKMLQATVSDFQNGLKQTKQKKKRSKVMKHRLRMSLNLSRAITSGVDTVDYTLRLMGNSEPRTLMITPNARRCDMSQAGSQGGCLLSGQRNLDANHTPPYTVRQLLKWTVRHDRCTSGGNAKKRTGFR